MKQNACYSSEECCLPGISFVYLDDKWNNDEINRLDVITTFVNTIITLEEGGVVIIIYTATLALQSCSEVLMSLGLNC